MGVDELAIEQSGIGRSEYWTKWVLDEVGMDLLGVDEVGMDEVAVPRNVTRCFAYKRRKLTYTVRFRTIIVIFNIAVVASIPHPLTLTTRLILTPQRI